MTITSGLGNATVFYNDTLQVMRSPYAIVPSGAGMPPNGNPQVVLRTPHAVVPENEPYSAWEPPLATTSKFLPDGRLVAQDALGAPGGISTANLLRGVVIGLSAGLGAGVGAMTARKRGYGAVVGGAVGLSTGVVLALTAALGAAYVAEADNTPAK